MALEVRSRKICDFLVVVDLVGRLDVLAPMLLPVIEERVSHGERHFVLNLTSLEYIDASGLGQLVRIWNCVTKAGGRIMLHHPGEPVRKLLAITRLDSVFNICEGEAGRLAPRRPFVANPA